MEKDTGTVQGRTWEELSDEQKKTWLENESEFAQKQKRRVSYREGGDDLRR